MVLERGIEGKGTGGGAAENDADRRDSPFASNGQVAERAAAFVKNFGLASEIGTTCLDERDGR